MVSRKPNFLVIVADDLGFSDCSCFGSEIQTPNIDSLAFADNGLRFTSFHVAAACSPTRSMLMTGTDHHLTGLGQLSEYVRNSPAHQGQPGHEGFLNDNVVALPQLLRDGGYLTLMSGKWHLGLKREHSPWAKGFDRSFALLPGCANHYGWEPEYDDPVKEPPRFFETAVTALHREDADYVRKLPEDFYSSDYYASKLISYFEERNEVDKEKPFFAYLPFSAPHWPLQAPKQSSDKYVGLYNDGPEALRIRRLERLRKQGLVPHDVIPHEIVTSAGEPSEWSAMTSAEQAKSARSMEVYAGMVDRMDENIGRVIDYLKKTGEFDNTYVYFMSDNGAEGASYEAHPIMGNNIIQHIEQYYDNSLDNIGQRDSFVWYGVRWAQAATAPSRLYKMFSTEGGCRVPLVVKPASQGESNMHRSSTGAGITHAFGTVMDIVPTVLDLAGIQHPGSTYNNHPIARLMGKSWKTFLAEAAERGHPNADTMAIHGENTVTGWEIAGSGALRRGRYKITYVPLPKGPQRWELFDIIADPGETNDLSETEVVLFQEMLGLWDIYKKEVGVVGLSRDSDGKRDVDLSRPIDDFEDTGRWIRFMGREGIPEQYLKLVPT